MWTVKKMRQAGFSLLEMLLAVGVFGAVTFGAVQVTKQWAGGQVSDNAARHMQQIRQGAKDYMQDDFENLPAGSICGGSTCDTVAELVGQGYLPDGFPARNPIGQTMTIAYRQPAATANSFQAFIYPDPGAAGNEAIDHERVQEAALAGGAGVGFIGQPNPGQTAVGIGGSWEVDPAADFGVAGFNVDPTNPDSGAYLTAQVWYTEQDFAGPYLMRNQIAGNPDLNTMAVDLNMGGNEIINAGQVTADNVTVNNEMTVSGDFTIDGPTTFNQPVSVDDQLTVTGTVNADNLDVINTITADSIDVNSGSLLADTVDSNTITADILEANIIEADNVNGSNQMNIFGQLNAESMDVANRIDTNIFNADTVDLESGILNVQDIEIGNSLTTTDLNADNIDVNDITITNCVGGAACP